MKGQRRITFDQFVNALGVIAEKKGQAIKDVVQPILDVGAPSVTGTRAGYVKFHDDKVHDSIVRHLQACRLGHMDRSSIMHTT